MLPQPLLLGAIKILHHVTRYKTVELESFLHMLLICTIVPKDWE